MGALNSHNEGKSRVNWRWEDPTGFFQTYPAEISSRIEQYFLSQYNLPFQIKFPDNKEYKFDLHLMTQTDLKSGVTTRILRDVQQNPKLNIVWSWETDWNSFEPYDEEISAQIEVFYQRGDISYSQIVVRGKEYWIDIKNQCQVSIKSNKKRRIDRMTIPDERWVWQWQSPNGRFFNYPEEISRRIEKEYFLRSDNFPLITMQKKNYYLDLKNMLEIEEVEGQTRQIKRVPENYIRYKWLWKDEENVWQTFSPFLADKMEENYLDPDKGPYPVIINYTQFEINTKTMTETSVLSGRSFPIKRQAISNDFTVWGWTKKKGQFMNFSPAISKAIESHYILNDPSPLPITVKGKKYEILIRTKHLVSCETNKKKRLERKFITNNYPPDLDLLPKTECLKVFKFLTQIGDLPLEWNFDQKDETQLFPASDVEWNSVSEFFAQGMGDRSLQIKNLQRIQHIMSINYFLLEKARMQNLDKAFNELKLMFYIGNKEDKIEDLYNKLEETLEGHYSPLEAFGKGYYFTENFKAWKDFAWENEAGNKIVMCFWVLAGRTQQVKQEDKVDLLHSPKYQSWSEINKPPKGSHSLKGAINGEDVHVIYHAERCYPLYVIEYGQLPDLVSD